MSARPLCIMQRELLRPIRVQWPCLALILALFVAAGCGGDADGASSTLPDSSESGERETTSTSRSGGTSGVDSGVTTPVVTGRSSSVSVTLPPTTPELCALVDDEARCGERVSFERGSIVVGETFRQAVTLRYTGPAATLSASHGSGVSLRVGADEDGPWELTEPGTLTLVVRSSAGDVETGFDFEVEVEAEAADGASSALTLHFEAEATACEETFAGSGRATCDGEWETGCEVDTDTSAENCGACGNDCGEGLVRGLGLCREGACEIICPDGYFGDDCALARCEGECEAPFLCGATDGSEDCYCPPGTWGEECEESVCDALSCGQGTCQLDDRGRARCVCDASFTGPDCNEDGVVRATAGENAYDSPSDFFAFPRTGEESCEPDYTFELPCPDGWVMTGRRFVRHPVSDHIAAMGAICGRIVDPPEGEGGDGGDGGEDSDAPYVPFTHIDPDDHWFGPLVGWTLDNRVYEMRCPADHILVVMTHHSEAAPDFDPNASFIEPYDYSQGVDLVSAADWCVPGDLLADPSARSLGTDRLPAISITHRPENDSPLSGLTERRTVMLQETLTQRPGHRGLSVGFDAEAQRWCAIAADAREGVCGAGRSVPRCELGDPL